ncbi:MAG: rRNA adenine methyltransferase [Ardenticatenaceae bacterium]|nr:hypothetical protein [Anaerolineales bacterium]MCB8920374.1 rRNA adenine methyltransferase [Ardenticatenaceae bacterium]MCB8989329.1 rRNA adenine methyltransferase [Ardenticatenaceae bacterium]
MALAAQNWEHMWAAYDTETYQSALDYLQPDDVVLDIGAGDLRLARRMAEQTQKVYALEMNPALLSETAVLPPNVQTICADARMYEFPTDVTQGVLLMRHCRHFQLYAQKLAEVGCHTLVTNARWGMGVEQVDLQAPRLPFSDIVMGWYACICGAVGFVPGPAEKLTPQMETAVHEVVGCPHCNKGQSTW